MTRYVALLLGGCGAAAPSLTATIPPQPSVASTPPPPHVLAPQRFFPITGVTDFDVDARAIYALVGGGKTLVRIDRGTGAQSNVGALRRRATFAGFTGGDPVVATVDERAHMEVFRRDRPAFEVTSEDPNCLSVAAVDDGFYTLAFAPEHDHPYVLARRAPDGAVAKARNLGTRPAKVPVCDGPHVAGARVAFGWGTSIEREYDALDRSLTGPVDVLWRTRGGDCLGTFGAAFEGLKLYAVDGMSPATVRSIDLAGGRETKLASFAAQACVSLLGVGDETLYLREDQKGQLALPEAGGTPRAVGHVPPFGKVRDGKYWWAEPDGIHARPSLRQ